MKQLSLSVVLFSAGLILFPCRALAATIRVPADQPTIMAGIYHAVNGDFVLVSPGTYIENINFLGKAITVQSETGAENTIIDGGQNGSVVVFYSGESEESVLDGFTIRNGTGTYLAHPTVPSAKVHYGGGICCIYSSSPTIRNCLITENSSREFGGGIACIHSSSVSIINCAIFSNIADPNGASGGGICSYFSFPTIDARVKSQRATLPYN